MATYVELVNKAIDESGADLATYSASGTDFTTNTDPMLNRFKTWVARSCRQVQQMVFDWQFLNNQGIVTVQPGLMFYSQGAIPGSFDTVIDIYGTDDVILYNDVPVLGLKDLTYTQYSNAMTESFGYIDLAATYDEPLTNMSFKAGGDYFRLLSRGFYINVTVNIPGNIRFYETGVLEQAVLSVSGFQYVGGTDYREVVLTDAVTVTNLTPNSNDTTRGETSYQLFSFNEELYEFLSEGTGSFRLYQGAAPAFPMEGLYPPDPYVAYSSALTTVTTELTFVKAYLHSWKSFDFSEEIADGDYQGEICEINNSSFQLIDHGQPSPSTSRPLTYVPWEIYARNSDWLVSQPGVPGYITKDNTGRWRLYPQPDRPVTLKFEYSRVPQELVAYDDVVKGIPSDFHELIMWLAIRYYGEYDEQPSVARRADRYYKDLLQRLMIKYRPKFRIVPARLW